MKKIISLLIIFTLLSMSVSALEGNLDYYFETKYQDEFFKRVDPAYNYNGQITSDIYKLYNMELPTIYNSDYGSNIILPTPTEAEEDEEVLIAQNPMMIPKSQYFDMYGDLPLSIQKVNEPVALHRSDGSIGTLSIPAIGLNVKAYDGDELAAMRKGIGLINGTSAWSYNTGFVGHNRGTNPTFGKLKYMNVGDLITYSTNVGTKNYQVIWAGQIDANDWSKLEYTGQNTICLITCVENVPSKRIAVLGIEIN